MVAKLDFGMGFLPRLPVEAISRRDGGSGGLHRQPGS
jgi:hypothetical protein